MTKSTYTLELNEEQLRVLIAATDLYSRVGSGQFDVITEHLHASCVQVNEFEDARKALSDVAAKLFNIQRGAFLGINSTRLGEYHKISYDIHQVIRHRLSWDKKPGGGITVNFDEPVAYSKQPLPTITTVR